MDDSLVLLRSLQFEQNAALGPAGAAEAAVPHDAGFSSRVKPSVNLGDIVAQLGPIKDETVGILLLNLGGPDTLDDVEPFLYNLFSDPEIFSLPPQVCRGAGRCVRPLGAL